MRISYLSAVPVLLLALSAQATEFVGVDFKSIQPSPTQGALKPGTGIGDVNIGMTLKSVEQALVSGGFEITDRRNMTAALGYKPNGIEVTASSEKFVGRVIAVKKSNTENDTLVAFFTTPLTQQRAYMVSKSTYFIGNTLQGAVVTDAMSDRYGQPTIDVRHTAIRYVSWYKGANGSPMSNADACLDMPGNAGAIAANYMNQFDYSENMTKFMKTDCGGVVAGTLTMGLDQSKQDVERYDLTVYDNVLRLNDLGLARNALEKIVSDRNFKKPEIEKPKF